MTTEDQRISRLPIILAGSSPFCGCATRRRADLSPSDKEIRTSMKRIMSGRVIQEIPIRRSGSDLVFVPPQAKPPRGPLPRDFPFPYALEYDEGNLIVRFPAP